ncbi:MAG: preprotein translocase subunit YajC, partial [Thermodesulfobacteriota bacterium]
MKNVIYIITVLTFLSSCSPPGAGQSSGSAVTSFVPFILIFILFYFLILRPQQKQNKERQNMLKNVKRGDKILTSGGVYAKVINVNENDLTVEIAKGINIQ